MNRKLIFCVIALILASILIIFVTNYFSNKDENTEEFTFNATVIENKDTSILVNPVEGSSELNSSDKIIVRVSVNNATLKDLSEFTEGSKVKISYDGTIMESYPAQIIANNVEFLE